ncbi:hypothetical protein LQL77_29550 [Rhodococcus cerastii]|nr:hypothetical protein [Rhodococcus cerastii]
MKSELVLIPVLGGCFLGAVIGAPSAVAATAQLPDWYHVSVVDGACAPVHGQYPSDEHVILRCQVERGKPVVITTPGGEASLTRHASHARVSVPSGGHTVAVDTFNGDDHLRLWPLPGTASINAGAAYEFDFNGASDHGTTLVAQTPLFSGGGRSDLVIDITSGATRGR